MPAIDDVLADNERAIAELLGAADQAAAGWTTPRAPGKWSPSQVVEHIAMVLEESVHVIAGEPSKFPRLPGPVRPLVRGLLFNRVLKKGRFPRARTNRALDPARGSASPADARARLTAVLASFDGACRACVDRGQPVHSKIFGQVTVEDYVRFQAIHTRHHRNQIG